MNESSALPSRLAVADLARSAVISALRVIGRSEQPDPDRIAMAYRSDRLLRIDGEPVSAWSRFSGFWRTNDGWLRTHGNYAHHADALCRGLGLPTDAGADDLRVAFAAASVFSI